MEAEQHQVDFLRRKREHGIARLQEHQAQIRKHQNVARFRRAGDSRDVLGALSGQDLPEVGPLFVRQGQDRELVQNRGQEVSEAEIDLAEAGLVEGERVQKIEVRIFLDFLGEIVGELHQELGLSRPTERRRSTG